MPTPHLFLESNDVFAGLVLADVILDGAHSGGICKGVGALINIAVTGRDIDKHEGLGAPSQGIAHQHGQLVIPA